MSTDLATYHMWLKREGARQLRRLLLERWDPIGVAGIAPDDEYDAYMGDLVRLARKRDLEGLIDYLEWARTDRMGLDAARAADERVAREIIRWYEGARNDD
jgi:hypothetical protein